MKELLNPFASLARTEMVVFAKINFQNSNNQNQLASWRLFK